MLSAILGVWITVVFRGVEFIGLMASIRSGVGALAAAITTLLFMILTLGLANRGTTTAPVEPSQQIYRRCWLMVAICILGSGAGGALVASRIPSTTVLARHGENLPSTGKPTCYRSNTGGNATVKTTTTVVVACRNFPANAKVTFAIFDENLADHEVSAREAQFFQVHINVDSLSRKLNELMLTTGNRSGVQVKVTWRTSIDSGSTDDFWLRPAPESR